MVTDYLPCLLVVLFWGGRSVSGMESGSLGKTSDSGSAFCAGPHENLTVERLCGIRRRCVKWRLSAPPLKWRVQVIAQIYVSAELHFLLLLWNEVTTTAPTGSYASELQSIRNMWFNVFIGNNRGKFPWWLYEIICEATTTAINNNSCKDLVAFCSQKAESLALRRSCEDCLASHDIPADVEV